ncbi:serine/threonine-protein phosphatase [Heliobacterium undosum]|uniref:Serine/threonine-protein phosphatase n=1 Tax=Heliomicrobium undosum TaxID=121734 RepID=A0A845L4P9_9FIRM|nr:protein phosphatase 2C domain-containing protein [Heliomicrobium undosum]MZP29824.1 serine/threonine-protein phosphatase [Heliomicrobium undosum]
MNLITAFLSEKGGRKVNQDACGYRDLPKGGCWLIADGLGGHRGGEIAASIAVETILGAVPRQREFAPSVLEAMAALAQREIWARQQADREMASMRTTVVILWIQGEQALWAHIGDSRLYCFRRGALISQTIDHSVPQAMVAAGEISSDEIRGHEDRNRLLRVLGQKEEVRLALGGLDGPLLAGDVFLLCTDGLWEHVTELEMEILLSKSADPREWLDRLHMRVVEQGRDDRDNCSALAVFVEREA